MNNLTDKQILLVSGSCILAIVLMITVWRAIKSYTGIEFSKSDNSFLATLISVMFCAFIALCVLLYIK